MISSAVQASSSDAAFEQGFDFTVRSDTGRLFSLALSILRDEGEAQDAVQETLVRAWRSWNSLSRTDHVSRWLTRVCVNYCISRRRYLRSRGWPQLQMPELAASRGHVGSSAQNVDMDRAFRRLSLKQRAAIALTYGYGYTDEETAAFMGCRPGTVRTHVARALATLRKELRDA